MGRPALAEDKLAPKDGLNQDLLPTSNYLNSKCNQPDSESSPFASAKCKQMDLLRFNGRQEKSEKEQTLLPATNQSTHLVEGRQPPPLLWPPQRPPATTPPTLTTRVHSAAARDDKLYDQTRPNFDPPEKGASSIEVHSPSTHSSFEAGLSPTCSPLTYRGIDWPPTVAGTVAFRSCPQDASGRKNLAHLLLLISGD